MNNPGKSNNLKRLRPKAKLPTAAVMQRMTTMDRRLLTQILSETMECVYHPSFRLASAARQLMVPLPDLAESVAGAPERDGLAGDVVLPPRHRVLNADEEQQLFLRFNYCRYRMMRLVRAHNDKRLGAQAARELLRWAYATLRTRNHIVRLNTSLVMAMARRTRTAGVELGDLVSEGNLALLRCVDKFDCSRGFKLSTYACRAIMSSFARLGAKSARYRTHFPTVYDPSFERSDYVETQRENEAADCVSGLKLILSNNSAELSQVERRVINARFALDRAGRKLNPPRGRTLEQVGALLGVSKERVRQIQNRALRKLRTVIDENVLVAS
jgi:RNA polymerase sigma factor (sigma-70 family)